MLSFISVFSLFISFVLIFKLSKKGLGLNKQMIVAAFLGALIGYVLQVVAKNQASDTAAAISLLRFVYLAYINLLLFVVAPLVFLSVINSVISIQSFDVLKRIGFKTISIFAGTAFVASSIGLAVSLLLKDTFIPVSELSSRVLNTDSIANHLLQLFPKNLMADFASNKTITIVFAAIMFGSAMLFLGEKTKTVKQVIKELNDVMFSIIGFFIKFSPYAIVAIISYFVLAFGWEKLYNLLPFVGAMYLAMVIHFVFVYGSLVQFVAKLNFVKFLKKSYPATFFSFTSTSSAATLPITISSVKNMGVSDKIANFVPSLGATMNMNACGGIFPTVVAIFTAQVFGYDLTIMNYVVILIMSVVASLGTAGVPGAAVVMTTVVLSSVGLPLEGLLMVLTVDRLVDMGRTSTNVTGDLVASVVLAKNENELDKDMFNK